MMVGVWLYSEWQKMGAPQPLQLVELGPGRGSLAEDVLRVFDQLGAGEDAISLHLVEISPLLSEIQAARLCPGNSKETGTNVLHYRVGFTPRGTSVSWYRSVHDVPRYFSCFFAHEFFDAIPVHKLQKTVQGWREILVDLDPNGEQNFRFVLSRSETPACKLFVRAGEQRSQLEVSPESGVIVQHLAKRLYEDGGLTLVIDYGHDGTKTDTFRAFRKHQLHEPLVAPGTADLTADVDFSYLRSCAGDSFTLGPTSQASFLLRMGIQTRLKVLLGSCRPEDQDRLLLGYHLLIDPDKMGEKFYFFSMFPSVLRDHLSKFPVSGFHET